jgi:hypothetical protein
MHLMRVIEVAVKAVGNALGIIASIKTAQPSWEKVLKAVGDEMERRHQAKDPAWPSLKPFYEDVYADLRAVKTAWRNPSMHVDKTYDEERAEDIYNAVKGFMRHLATHLDEAGTFTP